MTVSRFINYVMADRKERERERTLGSSYQVFRERESSIELCLAATDQRFKKKIERER